MFQNLNPLTLGIKKLLFELLKENYVKHEEMAARLATVVVTEKDYEEMGKILTSIYYKGYNQAVEAQREQWEKLGYRIRVRSESQATPEMPKIFNQQNAVDDQR